jgi:branched-subunit amino acid aminotransferase/4-amino-4-deoxychorismate lyase
VAPLPACYTSARVRGGRVWLARRHAARLARDARALGLGSLDEAACLSTLVATAQEAFGAGEGAIRLEARAAADGPELSAHPRPLGADPPSWSAIRARTLHPGPSPAPGAKILAEPAVELARAEAAEAGADEALLFDAAGHLVEGTRTSIVVVTDSGARTPPLARGGVAGLARAVALEAGVGLIEEDIPQAALADAREIVALNAVRGARPVLQLDGAPVGVGDAGLWVRRLAEALACGDEPL